MCDLSYFDPIFDLICPILCGRESRWPSSRRSELPYKTEMKKQKQEKLRMKEKKIPGLDIFNSIDKRKEESKKEDDELVEDVVVKEEEDETPDYYDEKGKIATVRKKRNVEGQTDGMVLKVFKMLSNIQTRLRRSIGHGFDKNLDPLGR